MGGSNACPAVAGGQGSAAIYATRHCSCCPDGGEPRHPELLELRGFVFCVGFLARSRVFCRRAVQLPTGWLSAEIA